LGTLRSLAGPSSLVSGLLFKASVQQTAKPVMPGLDPGIFCWRQRRIFADCRVKPGNDEWSCELGPLPASLKGGIEYRSGAAI
jgi:hypothetical protein